VSAAVAGATADGRRVPLRRGSAATAWPRARARETRDAAPARRIVPALLLALLVALATLAAGGCRFAIEEVHDGVPPDPARLAALAPGRATLDDALAALGAPDRVEWLEEEDVLVYVSASARATHWTLENPLPWANASIAPKALHEGLALASSTIGRSPQKIRGPQERRTGSRGQGGRRGPAVSNPRGAAPLTLNGDVAGREEVRLIFTRASGRLSLVEVERAGPAPGAEGVAGSAFLR
jgi:hypothetical protein